MHLQNHKRNISYIPTNPGEYLTEVKVSELKDLWQAVKIYKMKKLFDVTAFSPNKTEQSKQLTFEGFKKLFPSL